jgi:hypothetical protein
VLERVVQFYMKSRIKTLRHVAGIVPDSSASMALRNRLKQAPGGSTAVPRAVEKAAAAILHSNEGANTVALLGSDHGIAFEWDDEGGHPGFVVKSVDTRSKTACFGTLNVGDRVVTISRPVNDKRVRKLKARTGEDYFNLCDVNPSLYPLVLEVMRAK